MKPIFTTAVLSALWLLTIPVQAAPLSADDFLPPVQASTPEQQEQLSQVQGPVQEVKDPATGQTVVEAQTVQDAINHVVSKHSAGAEAIKAGSGLGFVATGVNVYQVMENPTATRIDKRNAYVKAFLEAQKNLREYFSGMSSEGLTQLAEQMGQVTDAQRDLMNFNASQAEKIQQAVQGLLKGFVVYNVEDDTANTTVYVSIVSTPKTRGKFNRPSTYGLEADSIRDGLNQVLLEIQNGVIPPVGGKMIQVAATGEIAFVGYGSDVIRSHANAAAQAKMRLNAHQIAQMRAKDALVGIIIGDNISWKKDLDEQTQKLIKDFEDSDDGQGNVTRQRFEQTHQSFLNVQKTSEQFQSIRKGVLPPGVSSKTFTSKDNAEVYAVAVYMPSVSRQVMQAAKEMSEAQLLESPSDAGSGSGSTSRTTSPQSGAPRPAQEVGKGPSGQVSRDKDL